jgi:hypothetical protein
MRALFAVVVGVCIAPNLWAQEPQEPLVIELFTSKFCPNCPPVEIKMNKEAATNPHWLLLQQHVDYWDRGGKFVDPYGLPEATQRQYDYSNVLGRRAGEVFTPMPLLNGQFTSPPPLWLHWGKAIAEAERTPAPKVLTLAKTPNDGLSLVLPKGATEAWLMGVEPMGSTNALRVRAIVPMDISNGAASVRAAMVPKTKEWVALAQATGPGAVVGFARLKAGE